MTKKEIRARTTRSECSECYEGVPVVVAVVVGRRDPELLETEHSPLENPDFL